MKRSSNNRKTKERSIKKDVTKPIKTKHAPVPTDYFFSNYADKVRTTFCANLLYSKKLLQILQFN